MSDRMQRIVPLAGLVLAFAFLGSRCDSKRLIASVKGQVGIR